jgi:DNA-binding LacI/PurR family transcriptional regulator
MSQLMLPMIPHGTTVNSDLVSVVRGDDRWVYFVGLYPIYFHSPDDHKMFKLVTSQLIESGACRHSDIIKTFGVSKSSVNRALKKYRQGGIEAFF